MSLAVNVTLANIDCSESNDYDRIIAQAVEARAIVQLCGHAHSRERFCVDMEFTDEEVREYIEWRAGNATARYELHAGVATSSRIGTPLLIIPTIDHITTVHFPLMHNTAAYVPSTVHELSRGNAGLRLATSVA